MSPSLGDLAQDLATSPNAVMIGPSNQADGEVILFFFFVLRSLYPACVPACMPACMPECGGEIGGTDNTIPNSLCWVCM